MYLSHERQTLEAVIQARNQAVRAGDLKERAQAENVLSSTLRSLFAVWERYPDLKANQNVMALQEELTSTENRISFARQFYNDQAVRLNSAIASIPDGFIAKLGNVERAEFFQLEDPTHREVPQVKF
jgi:LemA protein